MRAASTRLARFHDALMIALSILGEYAGDGPAWPDSEPRVQNARRLARMCSPKPSPESAFR